MTKPTILYVDNNEGAWNTFYHFLREDFEIHFLNPENLIETKSTEIDAIIADTECAFYCDLTTTALNLGYRIEDRIKIPFIILDYDVTGFVMKHEETVFVNKNIFDGEHPKDVELFTEYLHSVITTYKQK